MENDSLPTRSVFRVLLVGALVILTVLPFPSRTTVARLQLSQFTSCVEVPSSMVDQSRKRASTRTDCDRATAISRARQQSRVNARNAIDSICEDEISEAEAEQICEGANASLPTTSSTSLTGDPIARSGGGSIDAQLPIFGSNPKLCVTLRNVPAETVITTRAAGVENGFCVFNNNTLTLATLRSRARCGVQCLNPFQHQLRVSRFTTTVLTGGDADSIFSDATSVLKTDDGAGDAGCRITVSRLGSVTVFSTGDGSIDSQTEFNNVNGLPGAVKVVNDINFCGAANPLAIGCAPRPGNSLVVVRFIANQEGILWAHEFGHNKGLPHRSSATAVMNGTIGVNRLGVSSAECGNYRNLAQAGISSSPNVALLQSPERSTGYHQILAGFGTEEATQRDTAIDIAEFVRQTFIDRLPYEEATKYSVDVIPTLLAMLNNRAEERHWPNIILVLSLIGDDRVVNELIGFVGRDRGQLSADHYRAKTALVMSLGYLINKTGSRRALDYLRSGLDPRVWPARVGSNMAQYQRSPIERNHDFAKHALLGLSVSGNAEAGSALRALQQRARNPAEQKFRDEVRELIVEALKEHQQIASGGLAAYYRDRNRD